MPVDKEMKPLINIAIPVKAWISQIWRMDYMCS